MTKYTKCDFCQYSINKNGKIVCQFGKDGCAMTQGRLDKIIEFITTIAKENNNK